MKILVINAGSSSLKYQLFNMDDGSVLAKGNCECIGTGGIITHKKTGAQPYKAETPFPSHAEALAEVLRLLTDGELGVIADVSEIGAVGHRVVHGGEKYTSSVVIDDEVVSYIESTIPLNPLHAPPALKGIDSCRRLMKDTLQVGVFDTAFYGGIEDYNYIYALPYELYTERQIRRYGFHGTSHRFVSARAAELAGKPIDQLRIITCHLGNGSSITAVNKGRAMDTSMGFTPQEGLPMGTRSGSIDPTILPYLINNCGMPPKDAEDMINKKSGLLGITGISNDLRAVAAAAEEGNYRAQLAMKMLTNSIKKIVGSYIAEMNGVDVLVFTAGIGENQSNVRAMACENMDFFGIAIDEEKNNAAHGVETNISAKDAKVQTWVIPTNEEYMIALDTAKLAAERGM